MEIINKGKTIIAAILIAAFTVSILASKPEYNPTVTPLVIATTLTGFSVHVRVDGW